MYYLLWSIHWNSCFADTLVYILILGIASHCLITASTCLGILSMRSWHTSDGILFHSSSTLCYDSTQRSWGPWTQTQGLTKSTRTDYDSSVWVSEDKLCTYSGLEDLWWWGLPMLQGYWSSEDEWYHFKGTWSVKDCLLELRYILSKTKLRSLQVSI